MLKKKAWIALMLALIMLLLSGCGEEQKRENAAAMLEAGKYAEAYRIYDELKDADMRDEAKNQAYASALDAFDNGKLDLAVEILKSFPKDRKFTSLLADVRAAQSGTYVSNVKLEGSELSFTLTRAEKDMENKVRIRLEANNDVVSGWIYEVLKPEDLPAENPCTVTVDLDKIKWSAPMQRVFSFYDNSIFTQETAMGFSMGTLTTFYKCIRADGKEGLTMGLVLISFGFRDTVKTFEGGTVSVAVFNEEESKSTDKLMTGERTVSIPAAEQK